MSRFSERLRSLRVNAGAHQKDIAVLLEVSQNVISKYEAGINEPSIRSLILLADYFDVSIDYLVGATDNPARNR